MRDRGRWFLLLVLCFTAFVIACGGSGATPSVGDDDGDAGAEGGVVPGSDAGGTSDGDPSGDAQPGADVVVSEASADVVFADAAHGDASGDAASADTSVEASGDAAHDAIGDVANDTNAPDAALPTVSIDDADGPESDSSIIFTVSLSSPSTKLVSVHCKTTTGTAAAGVDYDAADVTVEIAPGDTTKTMLVGIHADNIDEDNETFTVVCDTPTNATIGDAQGIGTINDNDGAPFVLVSAQQEVTEGADLSFDVYLSAPSGKTVSVTVATSDGSATAASGDWEGGFDGVLQFAPGETSKTVTVTTKADGKDEGDESVAVALSNPVNAMTGGQNTAYGIIHDNDPLPTFSVNSVTKAEGNAGTTAFEFTVTLSTASGRQTSVKYDTASDGVAEPGVDFQTTSGTIFFAAGETSKKVTVLVNGDTVHEVGETFQLVLSNPNNAFVSNVASVGTGTITNDDSGTLSVQVLASRAPEAIGAGFGFLVMISGDPSSTVTVDWATSSFSALPVVDYTSASGTVTFTPGGPQQQFVNVTVIDDNVAEPDEMFRFTLMNPTNAVLDRENAYGTIVNDD